MTPKIDKQTLERVMKISLAGVQMHRDIMEIAPVHPDETDETEVVPYSQIKEIMDEYHDRAYKQAGDHDEDQ